ncbi:MAG: transporter [Clostridiales bacterium]|nr:MAG: transporter [Clostridiales bacterium]
MLRDITIGKYYDVESPIHKLDPRFKLLTTFIFVIVLFLYKSILTLVPVCIFLGFVIYVSKVSLKFILKGLKPIFLLIIFTVCMNMFLTGGTKLFSFMFLTVTKEGLIRAVFMGSRLLIVIIGSSMMTYTTTPIELTDAIEGVLKPLKKIGVPSHEIAIIMSMALRFIPTLMEETDKIIKAQMARGANFESKKIIERAKSYMPILVPLFINSFHRADELAMAMESRCYRGDIGRTRLKVMKFKKNDFIALIIVLFVAFGFFYFDYETAKSSLWNLSQNINVK